MPCVYLCIHKESGWHYSWGFLECAEDQPFILQYEWCILRFVQYRKRKVVVFFSNGKILYDSIICYGLRSAEHAVSYPQKCAFRYLLERVSKQGIYICKKEICLQNTGRPDQTAFSCEDWIMEGIKWEKKVFRCATIVVAVVRAAVFVRKMRLKWKKTLRDFYTPILMKRNVWLVAYVWKLVHWVRNDQRKSYLLIWNVIFEEIIPLSNIANCCNVKYTINKRTKLHAFVHSFCLNFMNPNDINKSRWWKQLSRLLWIVSLTTRIKLISKVLISCGALTIWEAYGLDSI